MNTLQVVGIDSKGYGKVYKLVMRNVQISLAAKAIYAYLCSYAGNGTTAFPKREKVMRDLGIAKNTFTKHLGALIEKGYIERIKTASGNIYEIKTVIPDENGQAVEAKAKGYGTIPKFAMLDSRLSAQAKAVYAYFCSYAGAGNKAYPRRNTILRELGIAQQAYYKHYNALVTCGYITAVQTEDAQGRFGQASYRLNEILGIDPAADIAKPPKPPKATHRENVSKAKSQKSAHGEKPHGDAMPEPTSQKSAHGEEDRCREPEIVENSSFQHTFGQATSQKALSQKTVHRFLRRPNINNNLHNKQFLSSNEDKITNIRVRTREDNHGAGQAAFTKTEIKTRIEYQRLIADAKSWESVKAMLGHFANTAAQDLYFKQHRQVIDEIARQLYSLLNRTTDRIALEGKLYDYNQFQQKLASCLVFSRINDLSFAIADNLQEIKNIKAYVKCAVMNFAIQEMAAADLQIDYAG